MIMLICLTDINDFDLITYIIIYKDLITYYVQRTFSQH